MTRRHLRYAGISERTLRIYKREVAYFFNYLELHDVSLPRSFARLDAEVAEYINHLYQEDEAISRAGWLLSGLKRLYPRVRRELAISQQWYNNWCRSHTPHRATPLTWQITQAFIGLCLEQRWFRLALLLLTGFIFFLRLGEILALEFEDFAIHRGESTVLIRIAASKTSPLAQQSLVHEDATLASLVSHILRLLPSAGRVWLFSATYFRTCFKAFNDFFNLGPYNFVPYSIRRGGATYFYILFGSLDRVVTRGRWKDVNTARIYLDDARATFIRMQLPLPTQTLLSRFRRSLLLWIDRSARDHESGL